MSARAKRRGARDVFELAIAAHARARFDSRPKRGTGRVRARCAYSPRANPESEAELQQVRRVLPRIHRKLKTDFEAHAAPPVIPEFAIVLEGTPGAEAVEYHVRDHLVRDLADASTVRYVENGLIRRCSNLVLAGDFRTGARRVFS